MSHINSVRGVQTLYTLIEFESATRFEYWLHSNPRNDLMRLVGSVQGLNTFGGSHDQL